MAAEAQLLPQAAVREDDVDPGLAVAAVAALSHAEEAEQQSLASSVH